jgi:hypothetical protein
MPVFDQPADVYTGPEDVVEFIVLTAQNVIRIVGIEVQLGGKGEGAAEGEFVRVILCAGNSSAEDREENKYGEGFAHGFKTKTDREAARALPVR